MIRRLTDLLSRVLLRTVGALDGYVLRRFLFTYVANLFSFSLIFVMLDLIEHLDEFSRQSRSASDLVLVLLRHYGTMLPIVFCQVLGPIVTLTAGLFTITLFQRSNEVVPMLANGRSYRRIFAPMLVAAAVLSLGTFLIQELWIPHFKLESVRRGGREMLVDRKHLDATHGNLILMRRYFVAERRAEEITVLPVLRRAGQASAGEERVIEAKSMRWVEPELDPGGGYWLIEDGWKQVYEPHEGLGSSRLVALANAPGGVARLMDQFKEERLRTRMIPQDLEVAEEQMVHMPLSQLRRKMLESNDRVWGLKFYARFLDPIGNFILLLLGLPVITYFGTRNIFFGALVSALVAGAFFVASAFFQELAMRGFLGSALGAGLGPILFSALGVSWLRYLRT